MNNNQQIQEKLKRVKDISQNIEISQSLDYSLEDLNDAIINLKIDYLKEKIDSILNQLSQTKNTNEYNNSYTELEKQEEMIYLLKKKYSKKYSKAIKKEL